MAKAKTKERLSVSPKAYEGASYSSSTFGIAHIYIHICWLRCTMVKESGSGGWWSYVKESNPRPYVAQMQK